VPIILITNLMKKQESVKKMSEIKCDKCGKYTIEVIGDKELGCEYCLNKEELENE